MPLQTETPRLAEPVRARPRSILLFLVYGVFLVLIGVTATGQAVLVSTHFTTSLLNSTVASDAATVRTFVNGHVKPSDLNGPLAADRAEELQQGLAALASRGEILRTEIRDPDGRLIVADSAIAQPASATPSGTFRAAVRGSVQAEIVTGAAAETIGTALTQRYVIREYLPLISGGTVYGIFAVWRDAEPILARLDAMRRDVVLVTLGAALIAAAILYLIFRSANTRIRRQTEQLLEASRHDGLTGLPNHGSMVTLLTERMEVARQADSALAIAIVDVDNFRLLNDTHGHPAGDRALHGVSTLLRRELPASVTVGRYGPDEFLLIADGADTPAMGAALVRLTVALTDFSLQFDSSERLPVTVSAGIAAYPDHADSTTALLSIAAVTLAGAKASGGDAIRYAEVHTEAREDRTGFDVLQGLVIAVDTKDRYTKRHSEDVARYVMFLADQLGLDRDIHQTLRIAGLLHDVGKIGIPDDILRKPGHLTSDESIVIQQHVALGDSIVRNVPNVDSVRAAIRHHHERWDGRGYLDRLEGEQIPLIARIIAVGDVFSAMTTSRPYRKALTVEEALRRLGDAAGTQLDERLVTAFIRGIETDANPPLPGQDVAPGRLWTPALAVA